MTSREFSEWAAFYRIQPFGESREDMRMGQICAVSAAPHMKEGSAPPSWIDFVPERAGDRMSQKKKLLLAWARGRQEK